MPVPVADHEAVKVHPTFQHIGQQFLLPVHALAIPGREAGHHGLGIGANRGDIARSVNVAQFGFADHRIALVDAILGAAIADKVFGAG